MEVRSAPQPPVAWQGLLGYVNFSDGRPDLNFQQQLHAAYQLVAQKEDPCATLTDLLLGQLDILQSSNSAAFREVSQAKSIIVTALREVPPAYLQFHADLLGHQKPRSILTPFFLARVFEAVLFLRQRPGHELNLVDDVIHRLNDYVGYRPVPTLETRAAIDYYPREKVRPVPLYLRGVGVAAGPYHDLVKGALDILHAAPVELLEESQFELDSLEELAFDPRAYDHNHPANRRPNYVFGEWDPLHTDSKGNYSRFVVRQVILDLLLKYVAEARVLTFKADPNTRTLVATFNVPFDDSERTFEAAAVLAGTTLMASMLSGRSPNVHDSSVTLSTLVPRIAKLRDEFYERFLANLGEPRATRLKADAVQARQPLGGVRQNLNQSLAQDRALHLQERHLAVIFALTGLSEESRKRAATVHAPGVRFVIESRIRLTEAALACERGNLEAARTLLAETLDVVRRGIDCGALVDPWNILGFQGLFPLFASREDTVHDPRVDELLGIVGELFEGYATVVIEAAACGNAAIRSQALADMQVAADWWDRFASYEVSDVRRVKGGEQVESADHVATALARWRQAGTEVSPENPSGSVAFWREHLEGFQTPSAFARVVSALLERNDHPASMALLMTWLSQSPNIPLGEGEHSFHELALRWIKSVRGRPESAKLVSRFLELLEANADEYWSLPDLDGSGIREPEDEGETFEAAYEGITFRDSADDGTEGATIGDEESSEAFSLEEQGPALHERIRFQHTVADLLREAATSGHKSESWRNFAAERSREFESFLDRLNDVRLPRPSSVSIEATVDYDRRRDIKESLLEESIAASLAFRQAVRALGGGKKHGVYPWEPTGAALENAISNGSVSDVTRALGEFLKPFGDEPLLYVPLGAGGHPHHILRARTAQAMLNALLQRIPRLGQFREAFQLTRLARKMEANAPPEGRRVTEFDRLFPVGLKTSIETLIDAIELENPEPSQQSIQDMLNSVTGPYLKLWLKHSQSLRLSILETVQGPAEWQQIESFIARHGKELFTAPALNLANLRAVLHRGVKDWLEQLPQQDDPPQRFLDALARDLPRTRTVRIIEVVFQAVVENYDEYRDYNTTTTQSDYGNNLFILLDYLRLKTAYDRDNWRLRPLLLTHEVLCRRHRTADAARWQEVISVYTKTQSETHMQELVKLETKHGMKLRTVRERLEERFVAGLAQDRLAAQIHPLWEAVRQNTADVPALFKSFSESVGWFATNPVGAGLDTPAWIRRLEREILGFRHLRPASEPPEPVTPRLATLKKQLSGDWGQLDDLG